MARQTILQRFLERPPQLEGGLVFSLESIDDQRGWLRVHGRDHAYQGKAIGLSVPYPSGVRRLIAANPNVDVVLLEQASRSIDRAAVEQGVGYLDLRGRGRLIGPGFIYVVPPLGAGARSAGADVEESEQRAWDSDASTASDAAPRSASAQVSPFAPKASRVVRALLAEPRRPRRLSQIADQCRMNPGNVHRVLRALMDLGLVERDGDIYVVGDPGSLLEAWAERAQRISPRDRVSLPVYGDLRAEVERVLDGLNREAVVSGELAAELYAPHLPAGHALVHCITQAVDLERLQDGDRPRSLRPPRGHIHIDFADEGVADFGEHRGGLPLVSAQQLYVDLYRDRSRAREAAEHVRRERLGY
jgi:hypothetical protein